MKPGAGKRKGSAFEREVCKQLSLWITGGRRKDVFWRSAMSGGRATVGLKSQQIIRQHGDICAVSPEGHNLSNEFYIECKFYKDLKIELFLLDDGGPLGKMWRDVCEAARPYGKQPLLIAKSNRSPTLMITRSGRALIDPGNDTRRLRSFWASTPNFDVYLFDDVMESPPISFLR